MLGATTLIGLVLYPILFGLPTVSLLYTLLNPAGDSPEQTIEITDDRRMQISDFALTFIVVALSIASHFTPSAIGFTKVNWQIAVTLGALVSSLPLAVGSLLNRLQTSEQRLADPLNQGSLVHRSALLVLDSVSTEVWRTFCVASMLEMGFPAFVCILVVAFVYGMPSLTVSVPRAIGAAVFGCVAGLLFVATKSIFAPVTLSLISASAELYRSRFSLSEIDWDPKSPTVACPACGSDFEPSKGRKPGSAFRCPGCRKRLLCKDESNYSYLWFSGLVIGAPTLISLLASEYHEWVWIGLFSLALSGAGVGVYMYFTSPIRPPSVIATNLDHGVSSAQKSERSTPDSSS
jgi:hypothetical protein